MRFLLLALIPIFPLSSYSDLVYTAPPLSSAQHKRLLHWLEAKWERIRKRAPRLTVNELFAFSLECAEADVWPERIEAALSIAEEMQDRDPKSRTYGNFRWYLEAEGVRDLNAVEFSMRDASLLWMRHKDKLTPAARRRLKRLITFGIEGILRHKVSVGYTNIYLMKAWNLIAIGENFDRPDLAEKGYGMLDSWLLHTWENGIREYLSPTYYGVDLDSLVLIARFSKNEKGRLAAEAALKLFWREIAANWFEPCKRLGGAHSRDYDYLTGRGALDHHLRFAGWLPAPQGYIPTRYIALTCWRPPEKLREWAVRTVPRFVRQRWGSGEGEWAAHWVGRSISLGTAGRCYGPMDKFLTVQIGGGREMPMCYLTVDGRDDPYGKRKELTGGDHLKAFHLEPFVASVQRGREALVLVSISPEDPSFRKRIPNPSCLKTHFVLPREGVELWIGDRHSELTMREGEEIVPKSTPVFIRFRDAIIGVRVLEAVDLNGEDAPVKLVNDGNQYGVMRITIVHSPHPPKEGKAWTAVWVRVAEGLADWEFEDFRRAFAAAKATTEAKGDVVDVITQGLESKMRVKADIVQGKRLISEGEEPHPTDYLLLVNGKEVGRSEIEDVEPISTFLKVLRGESTSMGRPGEIFEVEDAPLIIPPFEIGRDEDALGGRFVWVPSEKGEAGIAPEAKLFIPVKIDSPGRYRLRCRVLTPTPKDDSFFIGFRTGDEWLLHMTAWHTGIHRRWEWAEVDIKLPQLSRGTVVLIIGCREDGAKIDALLLE